MPPATRSSAPSSPITRSSISSYGSSSSSTSSPSKRGFASHGGLPTPRGTPGNTPRNSPRRIPHCSKCGRPRAGHPRSGCPYVSGYGRGRGGVDDDGDGDDIRADSSTVNGDEEDTEMADHDHEQRLLDTTASLQSLQIVVPGKEEAMEPLPEHEDGEGGRWDGKGGKKRRLAVRFAFTTQEELDSLSSGTVAIVNRLLQPGIMAAHHKGGDGFDDDDADEAYFPVSPNLTPTQTQTQSQSQASPLGQQSSFILRWQNSLAQANPEPPTTMEIEEEDTKDGAMREPPAPARVTVKLSRRMPGTLHTPTASMLSTELAAAPDAVDTKAGLRRDGTRCWDDTAFADPLAPAPPVFNRPAPSTPPPAPRKARPIMRTMSAEERSSFIRDLNSRSNSSSSSSPGGGGSAPGGSGGMPPAMLFRIAADDVAKVKGDAHKIGFFADAFPGEERGQAWLVLGQDEQAVAFLGERFNEESKRSQKAAAVAAGGGGRMKLGAYAGGAVVGAVATWTGLAFS